MSRIRIFAYGSNMHPERMLARVPDAVPLGRGRLADRRLVLNKRGRDGSAKANLAEDRGGLVWGVLWELSRPELIELDRHEAGYRRTVVAVEAAREIVAAEAYLSDRLMREPVPYDWYMAHLVRGAETFGFPEEYIAWLKAHPTRPQRPTNEGG